MENFMLVLLIIATAIGGCVGILYALGASWAMIGVIGLFASMGFACYIDLLD